MKLTVLMTAIFLFLCGCSTPIEFVRKNSKNQAVVRYVQPSGTADNTDYNDELNEQATDFCDGKYKIKNKQQGISDASIPTGVDPDASQVSLRDSENRLATYEYVEFVCK